MVDLSRSVLVSVGIAVVLMLGGVPSVSAIGGTAVSLTIGIDYVADSHPAGYYGMGTLYNGTYLLTRTDDGDNVSVKTTHPTYNGINIDTAFAVFGVGGGQGRNLTWRCTLGGYGTHTITLIGVYWSANDTARTWAMGCTGALQYHIIDQNITGAFVVFQLANNAASASWLNISFLSIVAFGLTGILSVDIWTYMWVAGIFVLTGAGIITAYNIGKWRRNRA